jgi:hypothetical protein
LPKNQEEAEADSKTPGLKTLHPDFYLRCLSGSQPRRTRNSENEASTLVGLGLSLTGSQKWRPRSRAGVGEGVRAATLATLPRTILKYVLMPFFRGIDTGSVVRLASYVNCEA